MAGLELHASSSKTTENLRRTGECVLNLAAVENAPAVDRLAMSTGSSTLPLHKKLLGYQHVPDKFAQAGMTPCASLQVAPPRASECPVHLEALVTDIRPFAAQDTRMAVPACMVELRIVQVYAAPHILSASDADRIDPTKWRPLLMSFRQFFGMGEQVQPSRLGQGPEEMYAPWKLARA